MLGVFACPTYKGLVAGSEKKKEMPFFPVEYGAGVNAVRNSRYMFMHLWPEACCRQSHSILPSLCSILGSRHQLN